MNSSAAMSRARDAAILAAAALIAGSCARDRTPQPEQPAPAPVEPAPAQPDPTPPEPASNFVEVFPHVRINRAARVVEFDGFICVDCHHPDTPVVYLEAIVCATRTKEHESLVAAHAAPSEIHAAMLMCGYEPGAPGRIEEVAGNLRRIPPTGPSVSVRFVLPTAAESTSINPAEWVLHRHSRETLALRSSNWVFAGSGIVTRAGREWYHADAEGSIVGLATFGSEVIAWTDVYDHRAAIDEPVWIADIERVPVIGTPVTVSIAPAG